MSRILIAGCGDLGGALATGLLGDGHRVFGLRRDEAPLPVGVERVIADLSVAASLAELPEAIDTVVYAASPGERTDRAYEATFVTGVRHLQQTLARSSPGLDRFLFVSSTAVYAQRDGGWVDEESLTEPVHFSGRRLLEGERLVHDGPGRGCALRLAGIYGPGRTGLLDRVRLGEARYAPGPPHYRNRIHRDDAAGILYHLATGPTPPDCLIGVDSAPVPEREVQEWLAIRLGAPPPRPAQPEPGTRGMAGNRRCSNARLLSRGYRFRFPTWREGYAALLDS
ncbi:MAG: NAD-dependent epimerase/dehydratase family protein [bacterium]|nr:NAD-dependent epimerase/dehydratase family protein [bacterium]